MNIFTLILTFFPFTVIGIIALYASIKFNEEERFKVISRLKYILLCFICVLAKILFYDDNQTIFQCHKDTLQCSYSRSTIADPQVRFVRTYNFRNLTQIELRTLKHKRRHVCYEIVFHSNSSKSIFPYEFDFKEKAEKEINKIKQFLTTPQQTDYFFENGTAEDNPFKKGIRWSFFLTTGFFPVWLLYEKSYKKKISVKQNRKI